MLLPLLVPASTPWIIFKDIKSTEKIKNANDSIKVAKQVHQDNRLLLMQ